MIAVSPPSPSLRRFDLAAPGRTGWLPLRDSAALAAVFAFVAFLPYPAIPAGGHSAIQMGNLLALLIVAMTLFTSWSGKAYFLLPLILLPACLSVVKTGIVADGDMQLCFKSMGTLVISAAAVLATQYLAPRHALAMLLGIAWAAILHTVVGFWQMYSFPRGQFPLLFLYVNPSFLSVQENAETISHFIRRPFGLFPEPSAMSSSLAPWALFWLAELFGLVRLRQAPTRWQRILFAVAAVGTLSLIILSRSGHAMITLAAVALFAVIWLLRSRATAGSYMAILGVFGVALPLLVLLLVQSMNTRMNGGPTDVDQSWQSRASSLGIGWSLFMAGGPATLLFGIGMGQLAPRMAEASQFDAAWSVLLPFVYQTGMAGILVLLGIGGYLLKVWRRAGGGAVFAAVFVVWLVGITITTSYNQLLPLWMALGWLSVWPSVCLPAGRQSPGVPAPLRFA